MLTRIEKFTEFLEKNNITCFAKESLNDELKTTVLRSSIEVEGQKLPTIIVLDDSIYTVVRVQIIQNLLSSKKMEEILECLNDFNRKFKIFKYSIAENGDLNLDVCIPTSQEEFNPELVYTILDVIVKHLFEEYPKIMKKVWG